MEEKLNCDYYIKKLELQPHIEDGYFRETYRSKVLLNNKSILTSIYYLLKMGHFTKFRKLNHSDEVVGYHIGKSLEILMIDLNGNILIEKLGSNIDKGEKFQIIIPANYLACFKCKSENVSDSDDFTLFSCVCGPGFNYEDFSIFSIDEIKQTFESIDIDIINSFLNDI